jgi:hypothetical protein
VAIAGRHAFDVMPAQLMLPFQSISPEHRFNQVPHTASHAAGLRDSGLQRLGRRCARLRSVGRKRQDGLPVVLSLTTDYQCQATNGLHADASLCHALAAAR